MRCCGSATSWGPPSNAHPTRPVRAASSAVPGLLLAEDAPRTELNVGLHHSCRLQRGGCNPILFGGRGRGHCSALWRPPLHSSPFCRVSPSFSLICSLPARWGWSAAHTPPGSSHRIVRPPTEPQLSRRDAAEIFPCFLILFFFGKCLHRGNLPHARQPGDVPEHVHIRGGFTWEYAALTPPEPSPRRARTFGLHRLSLKRKRENTPDYKDGVLRHFKDDFLQSE